VTSVVKIEQDEIIYFKAFLSSRSDVTLLDKKSDYESFRVKINNYTIVGYDTGNIVINSDELKPIINEILYEIRKHKLNFDIAIGSDETGKGEWLGPLTIAAVALNPSQILYLQGEGVKDSKELNYNNIETLSKTIKNNSINYHVISIYPIEFNYLFNQVKEEGKNLNDILAEGHYTAINTIMNKIKNTNTRIRITIDEFDRVKTNQKMIQLSNQSNIEIVQKPRAEEEVVVAAASILAKRERDKILDELSVKYEIDVRSLSQESLMLKTYADEIIKLDYVKNQIK